MRPGNFVLRTSDGRAPMLTGSVATPFPGERLISCAASRSRVEGLKRIDCHTPVGTRTQQAVKETAELENEL